MLKHLRRRTAGRDLRGAAADDMRERYPDLDREFVPLYEACRHATMTSVERLYALYKAVEYVVRGGVDGDFVECGVWRGGSVMMMALVLQRLGDARPRLHCFDTFAGMPPPGPHDIHHQTGEMASAVLARSERSAESTVWALAPIEVVRRNLATTGYPSERISFYPGMVEETLPNAAPERIALLRLDTDWYASTKHELTELYPRLVPGGVLIIDDYGYFRGARQATDEYFADGGILLNRIDDTGRIGVKPG